MRFRVRLFKGTNHIIVNEMHLCLGHLILMLHTTAKSGINDFQQLIDLAEKVFEEFDGAITADSNLPYFDRAYHYRFTATGVWGTGNVNGVLELLFRGDQFLQFGVQMRIGHVFPFGSKKSLSNVMKDVLEAAEASYKQLFPEPIPLGIASVSQISDDYTHCYVSIMPGKCPIVTCRIGNRAFWYNDQMERMDR